MKHQHEIRRMGRRDFLCQAAGASCVAGLFPAKTLLGATAPAGEPVSAAPLYWAWWGWEPLAHYWRAGGIVGAVDARSPTVDQWYDRLHSESLARQMADLGINLAVTHFFKGFGLVAERAEQQRTAQLVKFAHRHGIKVLGYCQSRPISWGQAETCNSFARLDDHVASFGLTHRRGAICLAHERAQVDRTIHCS